MIEIIHQFNKFSGIIIQFINLSKFDWKSCKDEGEERTLQIY